MKKRYFIAWTLLPKDKNKELKPIKKNKYQHITLTKKDLLDLGPIGDHLTPTKVKIIEL